MALGSLCLNALLLPVLVNSHLRYVYQQTAAHWLSKIIHPEAVFVGDSITAGGRDFNSLRTVNLATNGLHAYQIAELIKSAEQYGPEHILVMAGTNDAIEGDVDAVREAAIWDAICQNPKVILTLAPPSRLPELNVKLDAINRVADAAALKHKTTVIRLDELGGPDGLIQEKYTVDGVHLSEAAYEIWRGKLKTLGI